MADWSNRKTKKEDWLDRLTEARTDIENLEIIKARDVLQSIVGDMNRIIGCCGNKH